MTSRLLSQIFNQNSTSIYETLHEEDVARSETSEYDLEERAGMIPQRNVPPYRDMESPEESRYDLEQRSPIGESMSQSMFNHRHQPFSAAALDRGETQNRRFPRYRDDDDNGEPPASLLFETPTARSPSAVQEEVPAHRLPPRPSSDDEGDPFAEPRRARFANPAPWKVSVDQDSPSGSDSHRNAHRARLGQIDPKERAMWKWANVENLDNFLSQVYEYFLGKGIWNILLARVLNLLTLAFVVSFSTFLSLCVDYSAVHKPGTHSLTDITIPHCMSRMSGTATFLLWSISFFWVYKLIAYTLDMRRVWDIYQFYTYLLEIPDSDMQTISWQEVVGRIMILRDANPNTAENLNRRNYKHSSKQRMDAHDIANRLMRRENYLIALFNKEVLDLTVPLPFMRNRGGILTRMLEWNLSLCILDFVFNEQGQVRPLFLKDTHRRTLSEGLRQRFLFAGTMSFLLAPFLVTYFLVVFLMRNLHDFIKTPARIGHREYTPYAQWKFREFNELWHLFQMRMNMSYPCAEEYVNQFPKEKTSQAAGFVSFVASSLLGVLLIGTMIDYELIGGFEIAPGFTVLSSIAILSTVVAVSRGMIQEEKTVYDPEWSIRNVIQHTHYMPASWKDKLHSDEVKREFETLYTPKVMIFIEEILSVIFTPFVLWFTLPKCCDRIIDFFREFTVHVDGVGYVCSFAEFNFQKTDLRQESEDLREEYFATKDNKMLASYIGFMEQYHGYPNARGQHSRRFTGPNTYAQSQMLQSSYNPAADRTPTGARTPGGPARGQPPYATARTLARSIHQAESPARMQSSMMMRSSLLDMHHQPPAPFTARQARVPQFATAGSLKEEPEDDDQVPEEFLGNRSGARYRSSLGESYESGGLKSTLKGTDESFGAAAGGGVLDLLNQFVGATEGTAGRAGVV